MEAPDATVTPLSVGVLVEGLWDEEALRKPVLPPEHAIALSLFCYHLDPEWVWCSALAELLGMSTYELKRHYSLTHTPTAWAELEWMAFWGDKERALAIAESTAESKRNQLLEFAIAFDDVVLVDVLPPNVVELLARIRYQQLGYFRNAVSNDCFYVASHLITVLRLTPDLEMDPTESVTARKRTLVEYAAEWGYVQMLRLLLLSGAVATTRAVELTVGLGTAKNMHGGRRCSQEAAIQIICILERFLDAPLSSELVAELLKAAARLNADKLVLFLWKKHPDPKSITHRSSEMVPGVGSEYVDRDLLRIAERYGAVDCVKFLKDPEKAIEEADRVAEWEGFIRTSRSRLS